MSNDELILKHLGNVTPNLKADAMALIEEVYSQAKRDGDNEGYLRGCKEGVAEWRKYEKISSEIANSLEKE